jgi:hypothetical protein
MPEGARNQEGGVKRLLLLRTSYDATYLRVKEVDNHVHSSVVSILFMMLGLKKEIS